MCFSASASFIVSAATTAAGVHCVKNAKKEERLFASIPFIFALQQALEGAQWLVPHPSMISLVLGYAFLFFAFLVWPSYIPISLYKIEQDPKRKHLLTFFILAGLLVTFSLLYILLTKSLDIQLLANGISYDIVNFPFPKTGVLIYIGITCGSFFISSRPFVKLFGALSFASGLFSALAFSQTFTSIWCFFVAALSILLVLYFKQQTRRTIK